ncbi:metalloprotease [Trametes elegans]|nr:metalloprotease [Trametes elegans]
MSFTSRTFGRICGTTISEKPLAHSAHFLANKVTKALASNISGAATVNIHWHVVSQAIILRSMESMIANQIAVRNQDYAPSGLQFVLQETTRTFHRYWCNEAGPDSPAQTDIRQQGAKSLFTERTARDEHLLQLRQGAAADLNVYSVGYYCTVLHTDTALIPTYNYTGLLGYSTFHADYVNNPIDDGSVILLSSLPGGSTENFNEGKAGLWVGLYHTFQGGYTGSGDMVDDTPPGASPASGWLDPTNNYLDYSDDSCMNQFTPGQSARMADQLRTYRGIDI